MLLDHPNIMRMLLEAQEDVSLPNPFDKITKLVAILHKASTTEKIQWTVELLLDLYRCRTITIEQMGARALEGKTLQAGGKGLIDLLLYKMTALPYLTGEWLDSWKLPPEVKQTIRDVTKSISIFRQKAGYSFNSNMRQPEVSTTWKAGWSKSSELVFDLIDAYVFGFEYDVVLRVCIKRRADVIQSLKMQGLAEHVATIEAELETEATENELQKRTTTLKEDESSNSEEEDCPQGLENLPQIQKLSKTVGEDATKTRRLNYFKNYCTRLVDTHVQLCSETESDHVIAQKFKNSAAGAIKPDIWKKP